MLKIFFTLLIGLLTMISPAFAETNVQIKTTGDAEIKVENKTTYSSKTNIRIESNGQVKSYSSDKVEDVEIKSDDGQAVVSVKNSGANPSSSPSVTLTLTPTLAQTTPTLTPEIMQYDPQSEKSFFAAFLDWLISLFR